MIDDDGVAVPLTIPRQKGETDLAIKEVVVAGRRYVLCRNEEQARKDADTRAALLAGLQRKLAQGDKALAGNAGYRRFLTDPTCDGFRIDAAKVAADARYDGLFVLRTNTKLSALRWCCISQLLAVEAGFIAAKTMLATRPIFHRTDATIAGHILTCSSNCSWLRRMADWCRQDLWRLRVRPPIALRDTRSGWKAIVPAVALAA